MSTSSRSMYHTNNNTRLDSTVAILPAPLRKKHAISPLISLDSDNDLPTEHYRFIEIHALSRIVNV
jgi:hypothetical protein